MHSRVEDPIIPTYTITCDDLRQSMNPYARELVRNNFIIFPGNQKTLLTDYARHGGFDIVYNNTVLTGIKNDDDILFGRKKFISKEKLSDILPKRIYDALYFAYSQVNTSVFYMFMEMAKLDAQLFVPVKSISHGGSIYIFNDSAFPAEFLSVENQFGFIDEKCSIQKQEECYAAVITANIYTSSTLIEISSRDLQAIAPTDGRLTIDYTKPSHHFFRLNKIITNSKLYKDILMQEELPDLTAEQYAEDVNLEEKSLAVFFSAKKNSLGKRIRKALKYTYDNIFNPDLEYRERLKEYNSPVAAFFGWPGQGDWVEKLFAILGVVTLFTPIKNSVKLITEFLPCVVAESCSSIKPLYYFFKMIQLIGMRLTSPRRSFWQAWNCGIELGEKWDKPGMGTLIAAILGGISAAISLLTASLIGVTVVAPLVVYASSALASSGALGLKMVTWLSSAIHSVANQFKPLVDFFAWVGKSIGLVGAKTVANEIITHAMTGVTTTFITVSAAIYAITDRIATAIVNWVYPRQLAKKSNLPIRIESPTSVSSESEGKGMADIMDALSISPTFASINEQARTVRLRTGSVVRPTIDNTIEVEDEIDQERLDNGQGLGL